MRYLLNIFLIVFIIAATTAPHYAEARAGGGRSMGSRGSQTYQSSGSSYKAQPIDRSTTAQPSQSANGVNSATTPFGSGHPFLSGIAGGLLGAGLAHMLFGGMGGGFGGLPPLLLIAGVIYFIYKRRTGLNTANTDYFTPSAPPSFSNTISSPFLTPQITDATGPLSVSDADKHDFEQALQQIQHYWSEGNLIKLRQFVTPEMLQYFSEELSANASRGEANKVEQVQLLKADMAETWTEYELDYATVYLQWSALDYTIRLDREPHDVDYIAAGSNVTPVTAEEIWTFARASGGHWLLSAIQQVAS